MASEIVLIVTEQRNRQRILLPAAKAPCSFGRGARCDYVLRRNNVGDRQFTLEYDGGKLAAARRRQRVPHLVQQPFPCAPASAAACRKAT